MCIRPGSELWPDLSCPTCPCGCLHFWRTFFQYEPSQLQRVHIFAPRREVLAVCKTTGSVSWAGPWSYSMPSFIEEDGKKWGGKTDLESQTRILTAAQSLYHALSSHKVLKMHHKRSRTCTESVVSQTQRRQKTWRHPADPHTMCCVG